MERIKNKLILEHLNPFKTAQLITPTDFEQEMDERRLG